MDSYISVHRPAVQWAGWLCIGVEPRLSDCAMHWPVSGGFRVVPRVPWNSPLGWIYYKESIDDRLNGTPLSDQKSKKTASVAHLTVP